MMTVVKYCSKKTSSWGLFCALCFSLLLPTSFYGQAQGAKKIEIIHADRVSFDQKIHPDAQILFGNVQLMHKEVIMICDSAILFQNSNRLEAFGDVEINQGDSLILYGDSLFYNGTLRQGKVQGNVLLEEDEMTLTTDILLYNVDKSEAYYNTGGQIVSKKNQNILNSIQGRYASKEKMFYFKDEVVLQNPDYVIHTDTMNYHNEQEEAYFYGPTSIESDKNLLFTHWGVYNTKSNKAFFSKRPFLVSNEQKLSGDSLYYDRNLGIGEVFKNIEIQDTVNQFLLYGHYGIYYENQKQSRITQEPRAIKIFEKDSLYLKADTLYSSEDSLGIKTVLAFHNCSFYKTDLQGASDTIIYSGKDSSITMLDQPVIWSEENQISGQQIIIFNDGKNPKELYINKNAFIAQKVDTIYDQYHQIKGRELFGYFEQGKLAKVFISGNGQSIYYIQEDEPDSSKSLIGINKVECSDIEIRLEDGEIQSVSFLVSPQATTYSCDKLGQDILKLDGLNWQELRRPRTKEEIMLRSEIYNEPKSISKPVKQKPAKGKKKSKK